MSHPVLTMIPGPTPVDERVLAALARPTVSHQYPAFVEAYAACLDRWRRIGRSESAKPFVVSGSGTFAMEMALVNLVAPGERLLVVSHGFFGDRWEQIAAAFGIECDVLRAEWGHAISTERLAAGLDRQDYSAVAVTHVDTSTGTLAPVAAYAALLGEREELLLLDGVCATAGIDERFDDWQIDVLVTGAQKAFGAPPGVAIQLVSERALDTRRRRDSVPAYNADWLRWLPIMADPSKYFSTPPVNQILALHEAMGLVLEEGLDVRFARHRALADSIREGFAALGLELFTDVGCRADTLSVVMHREGVEDAAFRAALAAQGVVVAGALGPIAGKAFRVGHMGNVGSPEIERTLAAMRKALSG
jgi:alanine-glyoxylate transaminase/serine-glyoxylate transaminase/serine-pyruvate transaminase